MKIKLFHIYSDNCERLGGRLPLRRALSLTLSGKEGTWGAWQAWTLNTTHRCPPGRCGQAASAWTSSLDLTRPRAPPGLQKSSRKHGRLSARSTGVLLCAGCQRTGSKARVDRGDCVKLDGLCTAGDAVGRGKRQTPVGAKPSSSSDKGLICRAHYNTKEASRRNYSDPAQNGATSQQTLRTGGTNGHRVCEEV